MLSSLQLNATLRKLATAFLLLFLPAMAHAEPMSLEQVVEQVLSDHPDLAIGQVDSDIARTDIQRSEGMLDPVVTAGISAIEDKTPASSSFQASKTQRGKLSAGISKPLASGGTLSASGAFNSTKQTFSNPIAASFSLINPEYRNQFDISYRYPLLRGADRPDYHNALIAADAGYQSTRLGQKITAHNLSLQALDVYYRLASDDINIRIAAAAVKRAEQLLAYQHAREKFGLTEASDRLQAEALLAGRHASLQQALASRASDLTRLNRLMLREPSRPIEVKVGDRALVAAPHLEDALSTSRQYRPEFKALQERLKAAEAQLKTAMDQDQMQLDLVAQLGTRSLDGNASSAIRKSANINDHFASLSIEVSDALHRNTAHAAIRKAELARQRILAEQTQLLENTRNDLANIITAIQTGLPTLTALQAQARIEKQKFLTELRKYREGRSDTAKLVQFEGDLSNAELQAELQRLNLELAERKLAWAEGQWPGGADKASTAEANPS
ncbi:MAG TPA: TolC family protein [Mariprofundaceae bacterium]|nr:TolC family protein [Mariprofundaceae bacterium]